MIHRKIRYNPDWRLIPSYIFRAFKKAKKQKIAKIKLFFSKKVKLLKYILLIFSIKKISERNKKMSKF